MELVEQVEAVIKIIALESAEIVDFEKVESIVFEIQKKIDDEKFEPNLILYQFLDDVDIRRTDKDYGLYQTQKTLDEVFRLGFGSDKLDFGSQAE